ncbi:substrate-binding domain-containing protein [Domibacillus mangrovi]|uniref:LacI family transcriptional regulator n=1 Tax=Domibacillus mangrovi TaxID=1714354 RepID=A0A1Q5P089_9BACI|nr:substrate-binding domain-containing protein [Domibacillus mangrovi]OKL35611.1 LacI family transcriptional regulator [Domibacillus mangrovi]
MKKKRPTLYDVAKEANVSIATVSNVLNNKDEASAETVKRVNEAIKYLGYSRNESARSLKSGESKLIGLIVPDNNPFFTEILDGIQEECEYYDWQVVVANSEESEKKQNQLIGLLSAQQVSGIILAPVSHTLGPLKMIENAPMVLIDREVENMKLSVIKADNIDGSFKATKTLLKNGHKRIGLILASPGISTTVERRQGYIDALNSQNIKVDDELIQFGGNYTGTKAQMNGGYQAVMNMMKLPSPPTAIFATNHLLMMGAVKAIKELKLRIPTDMSFIGFDDHPWQEISDPTFTIVAQPAFEMGRQAVHALHKLKSSEEVISTSLPLQLIIRESCGTVK